MSDKRIGIVGIENSHAHEIIRYLNVEQPSALPLRVTALVAGTPERTSELAKFGGIGTVTTSAQELLGQVDALIVTSRDGALHRDLAVPFLEKGIPVWVDKPLAASVADAEAIVAAARRGKALLTSYSALRWVEDTEAVADGLGTIGELQTVTLTGPADPRSEYSGIFFYGIHIADVAQRLVPGTPADLDVQMTGGAVIARYRSGNVLVTLEFVAPDKAGRVPFRATVVGSHGVITREIVLGDDYVQPGVNVFAHMLAEGRPPLAEDAMLAPIALLEHVGRAEAKARNAAR